MFTKFTRITTLALVTATTATAHDYTAGDMEIQHPMAFETAETAKVGAGYLTIVNSGDDADRLLEVRADIPRIELHDIEDNDGVVKMVEMENGIEIPAGETVSLAPGGLHIMFMGLESALVAGSEVPATLVFEQAGEVDVVFKIEERGSAMKEHDHGDHSDHSH
ncbi:MAG: copper chaperone PCu(A)C [Pseudomonadota bacterium]